MAISKSALQARINSLSKQTGVHPNILLKSFFFDAFLKRLASSAYRDNFIFKGGFLLSARLGINQRSTMDIDFLVQKIRLSEEHVIEIIEQICAIDVGDGVLFEYQGIKEIRQDDVYGGYNITLLGRFENIRETISLDIATGDPITPNPVKYEYQCMFERSSLTFKAYNFETIVAEKLQTVLFRGIANSRSKDFYDLFIVHQTQKETIDYRSLKEAFANTCRHRQTVYDQSQAIGILNSIRQDSLMVTRWNAYAKRNQFAKDVEFSQTLDSIEEFLKAIF